MYQPPFRPGLSATLVAGTASSRVALPGAFTGVQERTVRLYNEGPNAAFVEFGGATVVAVAGTAATASPDGSMCVPAGAIETFGPFLSSTHIAAITATGAATLRVTSGQGD